MSERELPLLAGIAACLRWLEELAAILSGPLLTVGLGIALVDLLTDGRLLASQPALLYAWAVSQSIGVDAQLVGSAAKASAAIRARRPWVVAGYVALVVLLAYVAYVASLVFATQEAQGLTTAQALARLGMSSTAWIIQRSALAVLLVVLSGFLRYAPPAKASAIDERAALERELDLEPLRARVRQQKAAGWRDLAGTITRRDAARPPVEPLTAVQGASGAPSRREDATTPPRPPTGPGTPVSAPGRDRAATSPDESRVLQLPKPSQAARQVARGRSNGKGVRTASVERQVRAAWHRGMTVGQLQRGAGVSRNAASAWRRALIAEDAAGSDAVAQ